MKKYKVVLHLMVDPSKSDETFKQTYIVEAETESKAYTLAEKAQDNDVEEIRYKSIFNFDVTEV